MALENVIIIGSGPAGLTAAIYAARANLKPLVFTGNEIGGQVSITNEVENYPGFPEGLTGPELVEKFQKQAERFGTRIEYAEVTEVDFEVQPFRVKTYDNEYQAKAIVIATGASPRKLGVPGEAEFTGRGVSYCATCDGFFFRDREIAVVGGGDSALEEGVFLTKFASRVQIIHRRDELRAGHTLQERAKRNQKIEFVWDTVVTEINGNGAVESIEVKNVKTGEASTLKTDGVFIYIGHYPNSRLFKDKLEMDEHGYLITDRNTRTSVPGVFAAGEIADPVFRQVVSSAGEGCKAAIQVERYLTALED
ncbi:MAG: thioredoxin-disulfide reductase [Anaerolineae bacterium]|jgi:thioredoxin reductase (NADPH)